MKENKELNSSIEEFFNFSDENNNGFFNLILLMLINPELAEKLANEFSDKN